MPFIYLFLICITFFPHLSHAQSTKLAKVAIVIDDMGYRYTDKNALTLPGAMTYAFLPHTTYGKKLAIQAYKDHHDILIHVPMESEIGKKLGPGALTSNMNEMVTKQVLLESLKEFPFAIGINNHMGSYLTQLHQPMVWTMEFLKEHNLLFLDSKTSRYSKAEKIAQDFGVPVKSRQIFLDNKLTESYIKQQFNQLIHFAQQHRSAIAIAHPHPETIEVLTQLIPTLMAQGIELVPLSQLYQTNIVTTQKHIVQKLDENGTNSNNLSLVRQKNL